MLKKLFGLVAVAAIALVATAADKISIIADSGTDACIVIPGKPLRLEKYAAEEMRGILKRATGVEVPMLDEKTALKSGKFRILIGKTREGRKLDYKSLKSGGFFIKSIPNGLVIIGKDDNFPLAKTTAAMGTLSGVYEFLERVTGVLWLYPDDKYGTVVRHHDKIEFAPFDLKWEPQLDSMNLRRIEWQWGRRAARFFTVHPVYPDGVPRGHAFINWYKIYGKTHSDFFKMSHGKRQILGRTSPMCVSNPEFHKEIVRIWQASREKHPGKVFDLNLCENDTLGVASCECERCRAWDGPDKRFSFVNQKSEKMRNVGNRYAHFYKAVYDLAAKIDPNVKVRCYAYANYIYPPSDVKLNPNIIVQIVPPADDAPFPYHPRLKKEIFAVFEGWLKSGCSLDYRPNIIGGYAMPENYVRDYYDEFQMMRKCHMKRIDIDGPNASFATQGPFLYVAARLCVNPSAKLDDLLNEYYSGFGPAKNEVRAYWEYWANYAARNAAAFTEIPNKYNKARHRSMFGFQYTYYAHRLFPAQCFVPAKKLLDKAELAAKDSPDDLARVRFLQAGLRHAELCSACCAVFDDKFSTKNEKVKAVEAVKSFRFTNLPAFAVDVPLCFTSHGQERNEALTWIIEADRAPGSYTKLVNWVGMPDKENLGESKGYHLADFNDSEWHSVSTDQFLETQGINDYTHFWYRISQYVVGSKLKGKVILMLGAIDESYVLYVNGKKVKEFEYNAATDPDSWKRTVYIDITKFLEPKKYNSIAIKLTNITGNGGLWKPAELQYQPK